MPGLPEFAEGGDLAAAVHAAAPWLRDGDVLLVTSKVVSKVEGRLVPSPIDPEERDALRRTLIDEESVRLVAQSGRTRIVENRLGIVAAAAGVDASNVPADNIALLPDDPDASAARLRAGFAARGLDVGVMVTDTQGRAWRNGVTDVAIGAAGVRVLADLRGGRTRTATSSSSPRSRSATSWRRPATWSRASWPACPSPSPAASRTRRPAVRAAVRVASWMVTEGRPPGR